MSSAAAVRPARASSRLLIPDRRHRKAPDWTLETALLILSRKAGTSGGNMFRTGRIARRGRHAATWVAEWRLSPPDRRAARAERAAERQINRERDNAQSAAIRAAALEAERHRQQSYGPHNWELRARAAPSCRGRSGRREHTG
jgi:hypothetical protein